MAKHSPRKLTARRGALLPLVSIRNPDTLATPSCSARWAGAARSSLLPRR